MTRLIRLGDAWVNAPRYDYLLTAIAVGIAIAVNPRDLLLSEQHGDWYQTLATVTGALVGVSGLAITLVLTVTPNDRLERVLGEVGPHLGRLVMSCIAGLVLATGGFAAMFLLETGPHRLRVGATATLAAFTCLRFARLWRLFSGVILVLTTPGQSPADAEEWRRPEVGPTDYAVQRRRVGRAGSKR